MWQGGKYDISLKHTRTVLKISVSLLHCAYMFRTRIYSIYVLTLEPRDCKSRFYIDLDLGYESMDLDLDSSLELD